MDALFNTALPHMTLIISVPCANKKEVSPPTSEIAVNVWQ
jgi:hypothetical protein